MDSWIAFERDEPEMAEKGRALLYQRGDGEGFLRTVAANGTPRIHPPRTTPCTRTRMPRSHEFTVRGQARVVTDPGTLHAAAAAVSLLAQQRRIDR